MNRKINTIKKLSSYLIALGVASVSLSSCEKEENEQPKSESTSTSGITMLFKSTGGDETEFIINKEDIMSGEISAEGEGIELIGWRFAYPVGNTLFTSGYGTDNQCAAYADDGTGKIYKKGGFTYDNALEMFGHSNDNNTLLAMEIPRAGFASRKLYFIDVNSGFVSKIKETDIFQSIPDSLISWPTALQVRGDKLFVPFHIMDAKGYFTTPRADTAYVAVLPYPGIDSVEKIIKDPRTSNIGVNGSTTGMIETESGDLYSYSCGAEMAGFAPAATKPSAILKINSGETDFDASYFFDIEAATNGGKLFWFDYVGNNKAIGRILTHDNGGAWGAFGRSSFNQKLVIIDLVNQTVTDVADVPLHAKRFTSPVMVENGKVYVSIETASEAHVYQVDVENATAIKGAKINGKTIKGFYRL